MPNAPIEYASAGGQGGTLTSVTRADLNLYRKAIRGGYNIPPELRQEIVAIAREIMNAPPDVLDGVVQCRDQIAAAKLLLAADKLDIEVEKMAAGPGGINVSGDANIQVNVDGSLRQGERVIATMSDNDLRRRIAELESAAGK